MASLSDVTSDWRSDAESDLAEAITGAKEARTAANDAAAEVKRVQGKVSTLASRELSLLTRLDGAPSPADLDQLKNELVEVRRELRKARGKFVIAMRDADLASRAATRAEAAVGRARDALARATAAANDAANIKARATDLEAATTKPPVSTAAERAAAVLADQFSKAKKHIEDQVGSDVVKLAEAQGAVVEVETTAPATLQAGALRAAAIVGDEYESRAVLLNAIEALSQHVRSAPTRLTSSTARLEAIIVSPKASNEAVAAVAAAVQPAAATRLATERTTAATLAAATASHTVATWVHGALVIARGDPEHDDVKAAAAAEKAASKGRDQAAEAHTTAADAVTDDDPTALEAWNDATPVTIWPLLADLVEASNSLRGLAASNSAALVSAVTAADTAAAEVLATRRNRLTWVNSLGLDLDRRSDELAVSVASRTPRYIAALSS